MSALRDIQFQRHDLSSIIIRGYRGWVMLNTLAPYADRIMLCVDAHDELVEALQVMVNKYTGLVNCDDESDWEPEKEAEVISARTLISKLENMICFSMEKTL